MSFGKRLLAAALLTSVVAVGLIPAVAQPAPAPANPGAMLADAGHHASIAPSEQGKTRFESTYPNLGSDAPWIHFPTHPGHIFGKLRHVPPGDPVQLTTPQPSPWQQGTAAMPRDVRCFNKPKPEDNCNGYGHTRM